MSQKINAKNLSYNSSLPPFLAALHAQASGATGPDPILSAQRRGAKKRSGSEEAEDAPLVVDEHGHALEDLRVNKDGTVEETAANGEGGGDKETRGGNPDAATKSEGEPAKASIGGRKRKVGKVIGDEAQDGADGSSSAKTKNETSTKDTGDGDQQANNRKTKKKAKKIKLSFDEDEG
ncbi:hypothetical protein J3F83DRAFT_749279 [Trichoderma novae-zelandiae]